MAALRRPGRHRLAEPDLPFRVLVVCTANHCRSPLAEVLLQDAVDRAGLPWAVGSAGTAARAGVPMHRFAAQVLTERGLDPLPFRSRALDRRMLADADLVLTAERSHRAAVARAMPAAVGRSFTLLQFAMLLGRSAPLALNPTSDFGDRLFDAAIRARALGRPPSPELEDLPDPIGSGIKEFRECADTLTGVVEALVGTGGDVPVAPRSVG